MQDQAALTAHSIFELAQQARLADPGVATDNQPLPMPTAFVLRNAASKRASSGPRPTKCSKPTPVVNGQLL